ncbi:hypothetical protein HGP17_28710 [Rhizobium sp. P38BS-XIX]|uniref:hypothetical protein n=1 Tax=Rhizobium sp. P38BS-XIX TaxID=2726740 RepID=UPI001456C50A|nr:hypothetical protein [Rhizobium sp. P38BS-XIX]NLS00830.1 hypothetical protein [Rhizobium sp. P38BS-XIX]
MKNAAMGALVYELLFEVYRKMEYDRKGGFIQSFPDENDVLREAFYHEFTGRWEWSAGTLEEVGVLKPFKSNSRMWGPYFYPVMTLDECAEADFSEYETFDNYCVAMFSFQHLLYGFALHGRVDLSFRSSRFPDAVASKDDIFVDADPGIIFDDARFEEKVLQRWRTLEVRCIYRKGDAASAS